MSDIVQDTHYVFDGESLLQRLPQTVGRTFDEIFQSFKRYLLSNYGTVENVTVVFDGCYLVPSTKGSKQIRRKGSITKVEKNVEWTFDGDFCYCKGAATCQNIITSCIIPLGVMYLLVIMLDQYKVSVEHH